MAPSARAECKRAALRQTHRAGYRQFGRGWLLWWRRGSWRANHRHSRRVISRDRGGRAKSSQSRATSSSPQLVPVAACARVLDDETDSARDIPPLTGALCAAPLSPTPLGVAVVSFTESEQTMRPN